jgi:hypothetical protein
MAQQSAKVMNKNAAICFVCIFSPLSPPAVGYEGIAPDFNYDLTTICGNLIAEVNLNPACRPDNICSIPAVEGMH